jgi:putative transposase
VSLAAFIATQRAQYGIPHAVACRAVGVSQAWFYKWCKGDVSLRRKRRAAVDAAVAYEFARRQGRDGSPPITIRLRDAGWRISKNTVADSMRRQGLVARPKRRRRGLTKADRRARKPADQLQRDFAPPGRINQRWVSDLTETPTDEGVLYLASILDLASRRVIGYALGEHHDADLAAAAVQVAIATRGGQVAGVVLHRSWWLILDHHAARASSRRARWLVLRRSSGVPFQNASRRSRLSAQAMKVWSRRVLGSPR